MIEVRHLIFEYPGLRALDDVSFSIASGTITALVGPNGAGKTTLMRSLCGLERPVSGEIEVDGIDVLEQPRRSHERLGYLADFFGLYDDLTVAQCLYYAAAANGIEHGIEQSVRVTAAQLGLGDRLEQSAGTLSRGLRQRLAIGQAIIHAPGVLVLDEPASGLDPEARHELALLFRKLQTRGMTLLISSHILSELQAYATDMLVIRDGKIIEQRTLAPAPDAARRVTLRLVEQTAAAGELLAAWPQVADIRVDAEAIEFRFSGDQGLQHALLKHLIERGVPVASLITETPDLQKSYLETIRSLPAQ